MDDLVFADEDSPTAPAAARPQSAACARGGHAFFGMLPAQRSQTDFVFVPIWDAFHKLLVAYFCMPTGILPSGLLGLGHELLGRGARDVDSAAFDAKTFRFVAQTIGSLQAQNIAALASVPIDYMSLSSAKSRDCLMAALRSVAKPLNNAVSVRLVNTPEDAASTTLTERIALLRPHFRAVSLELRRLDQDLRRFAYMGLHSLRFRLPDPGNRSVGLDQIAVAIRHAKAAKLPFGLDAVPDLAQARRLVDAGAIYLSGPFLGAALDKPVPIRQVTLEDLGRAPQR